MEYVVIAVAIGILFLFILIYSLLKRYRRCPADHILVIYGKVSGKGRAARTIHGGAVRMALTSRATSAPLGSGKGTPTVPPPPGVITPGQPAQGGRR